MVTSLEGSPDDGGDVNGAVVEEAERVLAVAKGKRQFAKLDAEQRYPSAYRRPNIREIVIDPVGVMDIRDVGGVALGAHLRINDGHITIRGQMPNFN